MRWRAKDAPGPITIDVRLASGGWVLYDWVMRLAVNPDGDLHLWDSVNPFRGARVFHPAGEWQVLRREGGQEKVRTDGF